MKQRLNVESLVVDGVLPSDVEVLSTHNNLVVASKGHGIVFRIARITSIEKRIDPGDLRYAHKVAWILGEFAPVLMPTHETPLQYGDIIVSAFPLRPLVDWSSKATREIVEAVTTLGQAFGPVRERVSLRRMDVSDYAGDRLQLAHENGANSSLVRWATRLLRYYRVRHSFAGLLEADPALVHGDLHAGNAVEDEDSSVLFIDLDSIAEGPRLYDLASWHVRRALGDQAPIDDIASQAKYIVNWNEDVFHVLVGWKLLSSVSHVLRYGHTSTMLQQLIALDACGVALNAPGPWGLLTYET